MPVEPEMSPPPKYTEEQRAAIAKAVLDDGMTVAAARRAAQAGELEGVDPFTMSKDAAYNCVKRAQLDQAQTAAKADPRNTANTFARSVLAALAPSNHALLAQAQAGRDVDQKLRERARTLREYVALQGATEKKTQSPGRRPDAQPDVPPPVDLTSLLSTEEAEQTQGDTRDSSPAQSHALASTAPAMSPAPAETQRS